MRCCHLEPGPGVKLLLLQPYCAQLVDGKARQCSNVMWSQPGSSVDMSKRGICRFYSAQGHCRHGSGCRFAHVESTLRHDRGLQNPQHNKRQMTGGFGWEASQDPAYMSRSWWTSPVSFVHASTGQSSSRGICSCITSKMAFGQH